MQYRFRLLKCFKLCVWQHMVDKNIVCNVFDDYLIKNVNEIEIKYARFDPPLRVQIRTQLRTKFWK